jgi:hypothetical protein
VLFPLVRAAGQRNNSHVTESRNAWSVASTLPNIFVPWCLIRHVRLTLFLFFYLYITSFRMFGS